MKPETFRYPIRPSAKRAAAYRVWQSRNYHKALWLPKYSLSICSLSCPYRILSCSIHPGCCPCN